MLCVCVCVCVCVRVYVCTWLLINARCQVVFSRDLVALAGGFWDFTVCER